VPSPVPTDATVLLTTESVLHVSPLLGDGSHLHHHALLVLQDQLLKRETLFVSLPVPTDATVLITTESVLHVVLLLGDGSHLHHHALLVLQDQLLKEETPFVSKHAPLELEPIQPALTVFQDTSNLVLAPWPAPNAQLTVSLVALALHVHLVPMVNGDQLANGHVWVDVLPAPHHQFAKLVSLVYMVRHVGLNVCSLVKLVPEVLLVVVAKLDTPTFLHAIAVRMATHPTAPTLQDAPYLQVVEPNHHDNPNKLSKSFIDYHSYHF